MDKKLKNIWDRVILEIKPNISQGNFATLLKPTELLSIENGVATISAASPIIIHMIRDRLGKDIKALLEKETGEKEISVVFIPSILKRASKKQADQGEPPLLEIDRESQAPQQTIIGHLPRVRADYTFENFAVSGSNQLAFVSSTTVAQNPGKTYNPLFIYGPVGVGKTHLMHAIANDVYFKKPTRKVIYITSEEFTNEVVEAIRHNQTASMKKRFRGASLLLIDDIQFIEGKERVQEELFHTFNFLIDQGSQIALSSDRPPQNIKKLEKRLSSRFAAGLVVDIGPSDFELRSAIALIKAKKFGYDIPINVAKILAENSEDTRTLEGMLLRMITEATSTNSEITEDLVLEVLGRRIVDKKEHVHPDDVINYVCEFYRIKPTQLKGPKRDASLVKARQVTMYILYKDLGITYKDIGGLLGGRDHTTIMHGVEKIESSVRNKADVIGDISGITKLFRG